MKIPITPQPYGSVVFSKASRKEISFICIAIVYNTDDLVDVVTLGFILSLTRIHGIPLPKYDLCDHII